MADVRGGTVVVGALLPIPCNFGTRTAVQASCEKHSMEWRLRRVAPAAAVTTHAKPHAQQQLARDLEVERAAMGQRCRPQSFGEVQRCNPLYFL